MEALQEKSGSAAKILVHKRKPKKVVRDFGSCSGSLNGTLIRE
jgi:hypothetical protein